MPGLSAQQFGSQAMSSGVSVQAGPAMRGSQTAITNASGQPIQQLSRATLNANYQSQHSAFQARMATANQMSASLNPTQLMQSSGRSPEFIAAHTPSSNMGSTTPRVGAK
jgi:hypothetical protein